MNSYQLDIRGLALAARGDSSVAWPIRNTRRSKQSEDSASHSERLSLDADNEGDELWLIVQDVIVLNLRSESATFRKGDGRFHSSSISKLLAPSSLPNLASTSSNELLGVSSPIPSLLFRGLL